MKAYETGVCHRGWTGLRLAISGFCVWFLICGIGRGQILVDCTGVNTSAYHSITAALANAPTINATIVITGPCTENVAINNMFNLNLGAAPGKTATLTGGLKVTDSVSVYLYGLHVTNASGVGVSVTSSRSVTLDTCTSSGNQSDGLDLNQMANVSVVGPSSFDNNGEYGINLTDHAALNLFDYWGPTDISGNSVMGVLLTELSEFSSVGNLTIENNGVGPSSGQSTVVGYGIEIYGESGAQFGECFGPSIFKNNASGGISVLEDSQLSFWPCGEGHTGVIEGNGPVGITVGQGSQTTLSGEVQIRDHLGPGVDVSSNGNVFVEGSTVIENNGSANSARSAGVSLSGNSSALISGGQILSNFGPGLLVTLNSSAVFKQVAITGNVEGIIVCDNTSHMWTDLTGPPQTKSIDCTTPSIPPVFPIVPLHYAMPEMSAVRARQARYMSLAKAMVKPQ